MNIWLKRDEKLQKRKNLTPKITNHIKEMRKRTFKENTRWGVLAPMEDGMEIPLKTRNKTII